MGVPDSTLPDLIEKIRSWISWRKSDLTSSSREFQMASNDYRMCCECAVDFTESCLKYHCQTCARVLCGNCVEGRGSSDVASGDLRSAKGCGSSDVASGDLRSVTEAVVSIKSCHFCAGLSTRQKYARKNCDKVYPSDSPRQIPEPSSPSFCNEMLDGYFPHGMTKSGTASFSSPQYQVSPRCSPSRSDEDEEEDSTNHFCRLSSEYYHDTSDIESSSVSTRHEFYSVKSVGSSPSDSPSRNHITPRRVGHPVQLEQLCTLRPQSDGPFVQHTMAVLKGPGKGTENADTVKDSADDLTSFRDQYDRSQELLDFENNDLIWLPPKADVGDDEMENSFFTYEDEDDEIGELGTTFFSSGSSASDFPMKERHSVDQKGPLRTVLHGHFRALVSQLLQGEGIKLNKDDSREDWLDIVTAIASQAANYVRPDTSKGGSMDPSNYVKVKCLASGSPSESTLIKGVVCTKNIKHKRMTSQYRNARLLLLGGALEYQRLPNQLSSLDTVLHQETDHMKMIVSKIEAHHPNVLLVEKSVSSSAQEYLLAKDISLVLNVKRPLLERIARCTGSLITPSVDRISSTQVGHCELFRLERASEEHEPVNQFNKKPSKTLMFFEGCPRRLGCTVLLKGSSRQELKKVKHVVQYAVFAAYHLSLETSFLADEGASLPRIPLKPSIAIPEKIIADHAISLIPTSDVPDSYEEVINVPDTNMRSSDYNVDIVLQSTLSKYSSAASMLEEFKPGVVSSDACYEDLVSVDENELKLSLDTRTTDGMQGSLEATRQEEKQPDNISELGKVERCNETEASAEYYSATDGQQSILVSFSSRCLLSGTVCERSRLLRIKFYGCFDKPLGRYLQDDLFDQTSCCKSCKEPTEAHVICYTHQQGNLTINVKRLQSVKLPGELDGKIWMWHRCLRCSPTGGVPPATHRVVMSHAAWGLSFGKFLELSFSNHATANRIANCGHSLQRDCLRFYGYGSMVAFFRYSPIDILSVHLPSAVLEFNGVAGQDWIRKEAGQLLRKVETLYTEMSTILSSIERKCATFGHAIPDTSELHNYMTELNDQLIRERNEYNDLLRPANDESSEFGLATVDILELNRVRHSLLIGSHVWDRRLCSLDSLLEKSASSKSSDDAASTVDMKDCSSDTCNESLEHVHAEVLHEGSKLQTHPMNDLQPEEEEPNLLSDVDSELSDSLSTSYQRSIAEGMFADGVNAIRVTTLERTPSAASVLSDKIDSAWTGAEQPLEKRQLPHSLLGAGSEAAACRQIDQIDNPTIRRLTSPARVYSFDSAVRLQERIKKGLPPSSFHLSTLRSFHASGDYRSMVRDPVSYMQRTYSQISSFEAQKINPSLSTSNSFISSLSLLPEGARLMVPRSGKDDIVIAIYDNEPTSIISYALSSKDYEERIADKPNVPDGGYNESPVGSNFSAWHSFGSVDLDYIPYSYGSEDASNSSPHLRIPFEDESSNAAGRVKFSVTCYFAKEFDDLRKRCCPGEVDFIRSLSRCRRWSAQGGKSNVYFAKSFDERFIIKQVTKTELESFQEFACAYFTYMTDSLSTRSPTCLAKVLGIYQVTVKNLKGGKETKMDLMVMENLFYKRHISRVYDLKGSVRSRYNSDTTGMNKVLLDSNLLEALRTKPIFLGSKAKRSLERAVWNDTSFLASVDVMDYSLLVGVDDVRKELVLGIIDFMRQYTWDKHLETWVKASGILGGPKNASPTIISPKQYKKRFRKAMTTYFLTVPDQWSA